MNLDKSIQHVLKPLVRISLLYAHREIGDIVAEKRKVGWKSELAKKHDKAFRRTFNEMPAVLEPWRGSMQQAADLLCVLMDSERYYFPQLWETWKRHAKAEGLI